MTEPPGWFERALGERPEAGETEVDGCRIASLAWGDPARRPLVLVHGGAAHARWWRAIGPLLAEHHRVIAIDLSGHGESGWREVYNAEVWADEVVAVAGDRGGAGPPVVVGHSMGGFVTIVAAARRGEELAGAIVLDAPVQRPDPESAEGREGRIFRAPKTYPDLETAMSHFHLVPAQPCDNDWILDQVGRDSLREVEDGWTWRFDPRVFAARVGPWRASDFGRELARAACRVAVVNGADSLIVDADTRAYMADLLSGSPAAAAGVPFVEVPEAHHHLFLDQPLAVVTAIRAILAAWEPVGEPPPDVRRP